MFAIAFASALLAAAASPAPEAPAASALPAASGAPAPSGPAASAAPRTDATDTPTPPPVALDLANLRHVVEAAATGFKTLRTNPQPAEIGSSVTVYRIAPVTGALACEVDVDRTPESPTTLACHVFRGADLLRADDEFAAYAKAFANVAGVAGTNRVAPSRFVIVRTDTFALKNGTRIVLTNATRIDPHYRSTDFTIEAPPGR